MIIKRTIRYASYVLALFGVSAAQSCSDDEKDLCYKCTYTYEGDPISFTVCFEDFKDEYEGATKADFQEFITTFEDDYNADCNKK